WRSGPARPVRRSSPVSSRSQRCHRISTRRRTCASSPRIPRSESDARSQGRALRASAKTSFLAHARVGSMTTLEPSRDQIEIFVGGMLRHANGDGVVTLRAFYETDSSNPSRITNIKLAASLRFLIEAAEDDARRAANHPKPVVFCPPVATFAPTGR